MTHPINMGVHTCFIIVRDQPQPLKSDEEILPDDFVAAALAALCAAPDSRRRRPNELWTVYDQRHRRRPAQSCSRYAEGPRLAWEPPPLESMIAKLHMIFEQRVDIDFILSIPFMPLTPPFCLVADVDWPRAPWILDLDPGLAGATSLPGVALRR